LDCYNGESRTTLCCVDARPAPLVQHGWQLLAEIRDMMNLNP
jgi:hypothetical protein